MKTCLLLQALFVGALSHSRQDASFLGVADPGIKLHLLPEDPGISKTPRGLPLDGKDEHALADPKHEGQSPIIEAPKKRPTEHHEAEADHVPHHKAKQGHHEEHHEKHGEESAHGEHHAEGAEHGHGGHGHGEEHDPQKHLASMSLAYFLMGGVGALMVVFHFACSRDSEVKAATWRVLNMTVSIFVAVLMYGTLKGFIIHEFAPSPAMLTFIVLSLFVIIYVGSHALLFKLKGTEETNLQACGTIMAHLSGFAAMYGFADSNELEFVEEHGAVGYFLLIVVAAIVIAGMAQVMDSIMQRITSADGGVSEDEKQWMETCEETDDDVFCLAISFLIVLFVRYLIRGSPQPYEPGKVGAVVQSDANALLSCALGSAFLAALGTILMKRALHGIPHESKLRRVATTVQHLLSMIMAWSFLFWAEWQLYCYGWAENTVIGGCLVIAIAWTVVSFVAVYLLNMVTADFRGNKMLSRAVNSLELALGVLVGFSWERAFDVGFEEMEVEFHGNAYGPLYVFLMSLVLFAIVAPAWRLHILPRAMKFDRAAEVDKQKSFREYKENSPRQERPNTSLNLGPMR